MERENQFDTDFLEVLAGTDGDVLQWNEAIEQYVTEIDLPRPWSTLARNFFLYARKHIPNPDVLPLNENNRTALGELNEAVINLSSMELADDEEGVAAVQLHATEAMYEVFKYLQKEKIYD